MTLPADDVLMLIYRTTARVTEAEKYAADLEAQVKALENELTKVEIEANETEDELSDLRRTLTDNGAPLRRAIELAIETLTEAIHDA